MGTQSVRLFYLDVDCLKLVGANLGNSVESSQTASTQPYYSSYARILFHLIFLKYWSQVEITVRDLHVCGLSCKSFVWHFLAVKIVLLPLRIVKLLIFGNYFQSVKTKRHHRNSR